ncbi:Rad2 nuclease [Mucor velutinosus]|uniref:Rad2 nuclease n=1 Tax=Mucor velutinosus TaxID=708070 RepID=A0AAN7D755_9FUNG|nr:Rad2 nuclease [Mucor velutinosus]
MSDTTSIELTSTNTKLPLSPNTASDVSSAAAPKSKSKNKESVAMLKLFRFATPLERIQIIIASICSAGSGALLPVSIIIYGAFISNVTTSLDDYNALLNATYPVIHTMTYMGTAILVASYISNCLWIMTGESQTRRIRTLYLHGVLRQDMSWFDTATEGSLNTRLASDTQIIQDGISEKFGRFIMSLSQFITGFVVAFVQGWRLAIVMFAATPFMFIVGGLMGHFTTKYTLASQDAYAQAGTVAENAFNSIRTIYSFNLERRFLNRYKKELDNAFSSGLKRATVSGLGMAASMSSMLCIYALTLWYGSTLVIKDQLTGPTVFIVLLSMILGSVGLFTFPINLAAISAAQGSAYRMFAIIDRVPDIDVDAKDGIILDSITGNIEFKNIMFNYPTRPGVTILNNLSLKIYAGMTVAFVGPSGSGKSTAIQLMQRFYDPLSGSICLDGHDIKTLNVKNLRQNIGIVQQEPTLFNLSIRENILMGCDEKISDEDLVSACQEANCHTFVSQLPDGYNTLVGEHGGMLSGGQKQRIAIARAIVRNPSILLLDEATSALDTQSERLVQSALDKASSSRTTIVVAHRLSTIKNADLIVVLNHGCIVEQGKHDELLEKHGVYADLVSKQMITDITDDSVKSEDAEVLLQQEKLDVQKQAKVIKNEVALNLSQTDTFAFQDHKKILEIEGNSPVDVAHTTAAYDLKLKTLQEEKEKLKKQKAPFKKVFMQMRPEWKYLAIGVLSAAIAGAVYPIYAFLLSRVVTILSLPGVDISPGPMQGANLYAFCFFMLAVASFVGYGGQNFSFELAGEFYTRRLRGELFAAFLRQEVGYYDQSENTAGALTTRLALDTRNVNEMITKSWGDATQLIATVVVGLVIAFVHSWALTLILLLMAPFIIVATAYETSVHRGFEDKTQKANSLSGEVGGEAIREVRTIASLNKQLYFEDRFFQTTEHPHKLAQRKAYLSSIGFALNRGIGLYTNAVSFYAGMRLIVNGTISFPQMFTTMTVMISTSENIGNSSVFASTLAKAKYSALATFEVLERQPKIDPQLEGIEPAHDTVDGDISFTNVQFAYPARPDVDVFKGQFNLYGKSGQTIAIVGPSGCGKSTTIGMLQRWYDAQSGTVALDSHNVKSYTLSNLRSHMAIVIQEPVLFDMSIIDNIRFGVDDGIEVTQQEVEDACKAANIHEFIISLPDGYNTKVGNKGSQLSGGQKQRVSIARALIRKPKVLLLDEATSALDSDSERLVQEALDNILEKGGRTTITIAHRLSTIQNSDLICVVKDGRVVEQGSHQYLLSLNGIYSELVHEQSLKVI